MTHSWKKLLILCLLALPLISCASDNQTTAQPSETNTQPQSPPLPNVDVINVTRQSLSPSREYIGTTEPLREIVLRSQGEGQLLELMVDVGDRTFAGQTIARLDDTLLKASLYRAEAELVSLQSGVTEAQADVISALAAVESAQVRLAQSQTDANRLQQLYEEGAIALREVELAQTEVQTGKQEVLAAQSQVKVREAAVETAKGRIIAQQAVIAEEKKRLAYTEIKAPRDGYVLQKLTEEGNLIQTGGEIITLGDFSQVKVAVAVSELELENLVLGKTVEISIDAFPQEKFTGIVNRISPSADGNSRQIPVEILLSNPQDRLKRGLLARVKFVNDNPRLVIPESALNVGGKDLNNQVFVLDSQALENKVVARQVTLGKSRNGMVEILAGLGEKDRIVARSNRILTNNQSVKISAISVE